MGQPILFVGAAQLCCPVASLCQDMQQGKTVRGKLGWQVLFGARKEKKRNMKMNDTPLFPKDMF